MTRCIAAILLLAGCVAAPSNTQQLVRIYELEPVASDGAPLPTGVPDPMEWRFVAEEEVWRPALPRNPTIAAARVEHVDGSLRITLGEGTRTGGGSVGAGIYSDVSDWAPGDWGFLEVRARTTNPDVIINPAFNLLPKQGPDDAGAYPFADSRPGTPVAPDGEPHVYLLNADCPVWRNDTCDTTWQQVGLWIGAPDTASVEVLSIRAIPKELPYAEATTGVRDVGDPQRPTVYVRAPGAVEYRVSVPTSGQLDLGLGVLRDEAPVDFRVSAVDDDGAEWSLLEERRAEHSGWSRRVLDLTHLAGREVTLRLAADAERSGTVALFREPTLYTPGELAIEIVDDELGSPTTIRARLERQGGGIAPLPEAAIGVLWGPNDVGQGFGFQRDSSFYVDGAFSVSVRPGTYHLTASKGPEFVSVEDDLVVTAGEQTNATVPMRRWVDMPARGWYSGDDHIHLRRSPREDPLILKWIAAEDIHVGALLQMGDFWATYFAQYAWGTDGVYQLDDFMLTSGQEEPRTHEIGHTISLAADDFVRYQGDYYYYDRVFDRVHELGGLTGYAHHGVGFHGYRGLTMDVLRNKVDFIEILQFGQMQLEHYYHFLDLGFPLTALAGSDFPWSGQIGEARFYTHIGGELTFGDWRENMKAGRTFVSSGPMLEFDVNGEMPGTTLAVEAGDRLSVRARALGHAEQVPLGSLEIVAHGEVVARVEPGESGQSTERLAIDLDLPAEGGVWIAARAYGGSRQYAHTTPVYVSVDGSGFHNPTNALDRLELNEHYLDELEHEISQPSEATNLQAWRYREGLELRIEETRRIIERLKETLGPRG